jgi:DNA modification methylase
VTTPGEQFDAIGLTPDWQSDDGKVRLYCADCMDILPQLPDGCVDAVVTDPPYGVGLAEWDAAIPPQSCLDECRRVSPSVIWFGAARPDAQAAVLALEPRPRRTYVWWNTFTRTSSDGAFWQWQPWYVWGEFQGMGRDVVQMSANFGSDCKKRVHPAQKPLPLMKEIVGSASHEGGGIVLDPFLGSGTTAVACVNTGRKCIGIEKEPKYFDIAVERVQKAYAERGLFAEATA